MAKCMARSFRERERMRRFEAEAGCICLYLGKGGLRVEVAFFEYDARGGFEMETFEVLEDSILLSIPSNIKIFSCESRNKEIFGIEFVFIWRSFEMMPRFDSSFENFLESI